MSATIPWRSVCWQVLVRERQVDVFRHGEIVEQVIALENHADALAGQVCALLAIERVHRVSPNQYSPSQPSSSRASTFSSDDFPAPERSHHGDKFAFADGEPDAAQHPRLRVSGLVTAFYIFKFDHFLSHSNLNRQHARRAIRFSMPAWVQLGSAARGQRRGQRDHGRSEATLAAKSVSGSKVGYAVKLAAEQPRQERRWKAARPPSQLRQSAPSRAQPAMTTLQRPAPSASRTPISRVRCSVE